MWTNEQDCSLNVRQAESVPAKECRLLGLGQGAVPGGGSHGFALGLLLFNILMNDFDGNLEGLL